VRKENPNTLFFDGGDSLHGTKPVVDSGGKAMVPILNALKLDALVGHWDFAYGPDVLKEIDSQLNFPVLGCNVFSEDGSNFMQPTALFEKENFKIGVIGICSMIVDKVMPTEMSKGLKFTSGLDEIPEHIKDLKAKGSDIIILLSHNGFPQDVELKKLWIAVLFTVPILIIAMSELLQNNPLEGLLEVEIWNWI
jgi:5'-nucleotidase